MNAKSLKIAFAAGLVCLANAGVYYYFSQHPTAPSDVSTPQALVQEQLVKSAISDNGIWDQEFLNDPANKLIRNKIIELEEGKSCKLLKELNTKVLTHQEILEKVQQAGYKCSKRPLIARGVKPRSFLKTDNTITTDANDPGIAWQHTCVQVEEGCTVRFKPDGFPGGKTSEPHSTKAVLLKKEGKTSSYKNEAFKVTAEGYPIPKGPSSKFGLAECPYKNDKEQCNKWVDAVMQAGHPILKEPVKTVK
jgi:hypothetical protein